MSTVTGIAEGRVAILVTVDVFRLSDDVLNSKMSTVTGIAEGKVAILATQGFPNIGGTTHNEEFIWSLHIQGPLLMETAIL